MKWRAKSRLIVALGIWGICSPPLARGQAAGDEAYQAILKREFGTAVKEMEAIERAIQEAKPEQYPDFEARLIAIVESSEATMPGKQFACQMLRTVGSRQCIPAVSKLLTDDKLSHMARYVLAGMRQPEAAEALRQALGQTQGNLRIGLINTIGDRGDRQSTEAIAAFLTGQDDATARAAFNALGKMGGREAAGVLERVKVADSLKEAWARACLSCAASLTVAGESGRAEKMNQMLFDGDYPPSVRTAAFLALAKARQEQAVPQIVKMLSSNDRMMSRAAASAVMAVPGVGPTRAFVRELPGLPPEGKVLLLGALAARGEAEGATESVNKLAGDDNPAVRQAAIRALARLGNGSSVPLLAAAFKETGTVAQEATRALVDLRAGGVTEALIKQVEAGDTAVRLGLLNVLAERREAEALPVVRKAVREEDAQVRRAALKALASLGTQEDLSSLAEMVLAKKDAAERDQVAQTISVIGQRLPDKTTRCEPVLQVLPKADAPTTVCLLNVLSTLGGEKALQAVRASLAAGGEVQTAAIRALADWPDAAPMPDLLREAKENPDNTSRILALRGYIRMAGLPGTRSDTKLQSYKEAMDLAGRPEEKKLVLAGLADVARVESLKMAEACLEDAALQREAFIAYEKIAESIAGRQPEAAREALTRVAEKATDANLRNKAKAALEKIKK